MGKVKRKEDSKGGLRVVALFEGAKGLLVLFVGFGVLAIIHKDLHSFAEELVRHFHLNPAKHYPRIFIDATNRLTDERLWAIAFSALLYSVVRIVEAVGLWRQRQWAKWFGFLTGGIYIPIELLEIERGVTWPKAIVLTVNTAIVGYLAYDLYRSKQGRKHAGK
jgi:uncharacterized membrane protein (DUF2068 family)